MLVAIGIVDLAGVEVPWVNTLTAVLLILSGLFLVGTLVYAVLQGPDDGAQPLHRSVRSEARIQPRVLARSTATRV